MRYLLGVALLAAITPSVWAQGFIGPSRSFARPNFSHRQNSVHRSAYYPVAFFDPVYADYSGTPVAPEPRVIVMQAPAVPPETSSADFVPPGEPLLIELQDKQYVQLSGATESRRQILSTEERSTSGQAPTQTPSATTQKSVVLVFRDGHTENIAAYTITDRYLYASQDYYGSGMWNRKVALTALNLPETIKENAFWGISFRLPSAANEVIVGP